MIGGHLSKEQIWGVYYCSSCGKLIVAAPSNGGGSEVTEVYPVPKSVAEELPEKAKGFLAQAITCLHAPSAAITMCASAVDAMLKAKDYEKGTLNERIKKAIGDQL